MDDKGRWNWQGHLESKGRSTVRIMKNIIRNYPIGAMALLLLACVKFEYQTETSSFSSAGLGAGVLVLGIISAVLLFRIFNAAQDACIA
jgi:hypothetical protein